MMCTNFRHLSRLACFLVALMTAVCCTPYAYAASPSPPQTSPPVANAAPEQISDWALAGVVWSDASLTKKLATEALREQPPGEQAEALRAIVLQSTRVVQSLEQFGWKQVRPSEGSPPNEVVRGQLGGDAIVSSPQATSGRNAPAAVEDATGVAREAELEPFGVEDYVDETAREARNPVDAREDGVEAAIAAAAPASGLPGPQAGAGRISQREVQTRSTTLPYSSDSIYDADDYDPNIDYQVDNPLAAQSVKPRTTDLLDDDRDVSAGNNLSEPSLAPNSAVVRPAQSPNPLAADRQPASISLKRYTSGGEAHQQDAAWVQLRLEENQLRYAALIAREDLHSSVQQALQQLQTTTMIAGRSTNNESLKTVLAPILKFSASK